MALALNTPMRYVCKRNHQSVCPKHCIYWQAFFRWQRSVGLLNATHATAGSTLLDGAFRWTASQADAVTALRYMVRSATAKTMRALNGGHGVQAGLGGVGGIHTVPTPFMWAAVHGT
jgi:hypothetical protein